MIFRGLAGCSLARIIEEELIAVGIIDHQDQNSLTKFLAGRKGWRLPTIEELLSLVNPDGVPYTLPGNNPFEEIQIDYFYWTLTSGVPTSGGDQDFVWVYNFGNGGTTTSLAVAQAKCYFLVCAWRVRSQLRAYDLTAQLPLQSSITPDT